MRITSLLSSVTVLASLLTTSALPGDAHAGQRTMYDPATSWAVSRVADKTGQGNDYCAMARRFQHNAIVTFAKNQSGEASLALDFQKPMLIQGQSLPVTLDPGAGQQRVYEVTPVSQKAFVVRLGRDGTFFSALEKTGFLRIEIEGQSYSFNLDDMNAGGSRLDACIASMVVPAAGGPGPAADDSGYRHEMNAIRTQLNDLREENQRLSALMNHRASPLTPAPTIENTAEKSSLSRRISFLEKENMELRDQIRLVNAESSNMESELKDILAENDLMRERARTLSAENASLRVSQPEEIEQIKAENESLRQALEIAAELNLDDLQEEIASLEAENGALRKALEGEAGKVSLTSELEAQISALTQEKAEVKARLEKIELDAQSRYDKEIEQYRRENAELAAALKAAGSDTQLIAALNEKIQRIEQENRLLENAASEAQTDRIKAHELEIAELELTIEGLKADIAARDAELIAAAERAVDMDMLKIKTSELEAQLKAEQEKQQELATLQAKMTTLENENSLLKAELKNATQTVAASADNAGIIESLKVENLRLVAALNKKEARTEEAKKEFISELETLQQENEALKTQISNLQEAEEGADIAALQAENQRITADLEQAVAKLSDYEEQLAKKEQALNEALAQKQETMVSLEREGADLETMADLQAELDTLRISNKQLKNRVAELEYAPLQVAALQTEVAKLKKTNAALQSDLHKANAQLLVAMEVHAVEPAAGDDLEAERAMRAQKVKAMATDDAGGQTEEPEAQADIQAESESEADADIEEASDITRVVDEVTEQGSNAGVQNEEAPEEVMSEQEIAAENHEDLEVPGEELDGVPYEQNKEQEALAMEEQDAPEVEDIEKSAAAAKPPAPPSEDDLQNAAIEAPEAMPAKLEDQIEDLEEKQAEEAIVEQGPLPPPVAEPPLPPSLTEAQRHEMALTQEIEEKEYQLDDIAESAGVAEEPLERIVAEELPSEPVSATGMQKDRRLEAAADIMADKPMPLVSESFQGGVRSIDAILAAAHIVPNQTVQRVADASQQGRTVYQWQTQHLYGSAELEPIADQAQFDERVEAYLEKTQARCPGDFAIVPDRTLQQGGTRIDTYEVACVSDTVSSAASLLFYNEGETFTVMAHEAPAEDMDTAMDIRDRLVQTINGS